MRAAVAVIPDLGGLVRRLGYRERVAMAVLVGLAVRIAVAVGDDVFTNDASVYLRSGDSLWAGEGFRRGGHPELHFPPLYPAVLGGLHRLFGDPHQAVVTATLVASSALLLLVASLARRLAGERAAVAAVWIAALAPGLTDVPVTAGSGNEVVYVLLVLAALRLALLAHDRRGLARHAVAVASGLAVGGAYLTRPEGLFYAPLAIAVLAGPILVRAAQDRRSRLVAVACLCLAVLAVAAPYVSYLHSNTGAWGITAKTNSTTIETWQSGAEHDRRTSDEVTYELADDGVSLATRRSSLTELIREHPAGFRHIVATNAGQLWDAVAEPAEREHVSWGWRLLPLPLSALAAWGAWRSRRRPSVWLVLAALLLPAATALVFFVQPRYLIPATAFACILAGMAWAQLRHPTARIAAAMGAVLLVWSLLAAADGGDGFLNRREPVEHRLVGEWLNQHTPPDARVMTRSSITEYYAQRRVVALPYADPEEVLHFAQHHGVDYIVADSFNYRELRPQLIAWARGHPPDGYSIVFRAQHDSRNVIVLKADERTTAGPPDSPGIGFMGDG